MAFAIERLGENRGRCDCCGHESRSVWGLIHSAEATVAAYWIHWTVNHLETEGANLDLVLGSWGDGTGPEDRVAVSLIHGQDPDGTSALMVIDAHRQPSLAASALDRNDVINTPLAEQVFALTDAIYEQDDRFF